MADSNSQELARRLKEHLTCLADADVDQTPQLFEQTAETLSVLVAFMSTFDQVIGSQLEAMGKHNSQLKAMNETVRNQGLLDVNQAIQSVLKPGANRMTRLRNYTDLLLRWASAVMAGVQSTILEVPNEISAPLNFTQWELEKKRWSSEAEAYWQHFQHVIRHETPLLVGDRIKKLQAEKTLEAYQVLGGQRSGD